MIKKTTFKQNTFRSYLFNELEYYNNLLYTAIKNNDVNKIYLYTGVVEEITKILKKYDEED